MILLLFVSYPPIVNEFIWFILFLFFWYFFSLANFKISKWSNYKINLIDSIHANQLRLKICMAHSFFYFFFFVLFRVFFAEFFHFRWISCQKVYTNHNANRNAKNKIKLKLYKIFERLQLNLMEKKRLMKTVSICWLFEAVTADATFLVSTLQCHTIQIIKRTCTVFFFFQIIYIK